jgi:hypothetical protein
MLFQWNHRLSGFIFLTMLKYIQCGCDGRSWIESSLLSDSFKSRMIKIIGDRKREQSLSMSTLASILDLNTSFSQSGHSSGSIQQISSCYSQRIAEFATPYNEHVYSVLCEIDFSVFSPDSGENVHLINMSCTLYSINLVQSQPTLNLGADRLGARTEMRRITCLWTGSGGLNFRLKFKISRPGCMVWPTYIAFWSALPVKNAHMWLIVVLVPQTSSHCQ